MPDSSAGILRLPQQDLASFDFFALEPAAAEAWAARLPGGNPVKGASMLRDALSALNRVVLAPPQRFAILEALRAPLQQLSGALTQALIADNSVISEHTQQRSELVSDLCELGAAGYALVAVNTIRRPDAIEGTNPARLACEALQRAVTCRCEELLQYHLLYRPVPLNHWAMLHHLYALAERQQLANLPVTDPLTGGETSIADEYLPGILLACCKTNQLRQQDTLATFRALRHWRGLARLEDPAVGEGLLFVDLGTDRQPGYSALQPQPLGGGQRYLNTSALVKHLGDLRARSGHGGYSLDRETRLDGHLCAHLARALGEVSQRHFNRQPARHQLWIATGLSAVHYYVAGERGLDQVLHGDDYEAPTAEDFSQNPFLAASDGGDVWQQANPEEDFEDDKDDAELELAIDADALAAAEGPGSTPRRYTVFTVESANVSPGGYCVEWTGLPDGVSIGGVVALREQQQGESDWSIAVIRWISQVKNAPTLLGLELLSPRGTAYAAQVRLPDGGYSRPIRVILLPEIALVGQPHTLLAPRLVFKENQKIILARKDEAFLVKLKRQIASTAAFGQFDFEYRRQLDDDLDAGRDALAASQFESVWDDL
ncbi:GTPase [Pseudohaliea rubra]|uniref:Molecular chaperone n=1 Tax=Pseudohaliea rubra DSM 19751 TaxID=1265313 RepID=A0A095VR76_9GAMM|nr:GTPase [Pseudohaliea rubra]KGE03885.1 Molecular chaperone [Pseudohaliea rubra DSM 19751]